MYPHTPPLAGAVDSRMAMAREWDELVEQVRSLDGFADFLESPRLEQLLSAAASGPVVIVNVSRWRCDALIVTDNGIRVEPLPRLSAAEVGERTSVYLRRSQAVGRAARAVALPTGRTGQMAVALGGLSDGAVRDLWAATADLDYELLDLLEWLWDTIADPVLRNLGFARTPASDQNWPRLWWCPTGLLTLLPLHAAGYHRDAGRDQTVIDRVVSSYTPSLRALVESRQNRDAPPNSDLGPEPDRILVVALDDAPGEIPLPAVRRERDLVASLFPGQYTLLDGQRATVANVRDQLLSHRWAHFSCHGGQNLDDPSQGGLVLHDGMLTIADIGAARARGDFVFLCACKSATGSVRLPDESINLSAALHHVGYRHVIGTLWSVYDDTAADVAEAVYRSLIVGGRFEPDRSAYALHHAIHTPRDNGLGARGRRSPTPGPDAKQTPG